MKSLVTIIFSIILLASSQADETFEKNKDILDKPLYEQATAVVRVWIKSDDGGSKYHWVNTLNHATLKAPKGIKISPKLKVAYKSSGKELPSGFATLYLEYYNPNKPELGWKLIEIQDAKSKLYSKGYTHHSNETQKPIKMPNKSQ